MPPPKSRYREVARSANVSLATVYRVIGRDGRVAPELAARIRRAAGELGVDLVSKARRPRVFTFLLANRPMLHPFHARVLVGAQAYCAERNSLILFLPLQYSPNVPFDREQVPYLFRKPGSVDGFIVGGTNTRNLLDFLVDIRVPFAVLANNVMDEWEPEKYDAVWMDDVGGLSEATRHLLSLGHRDVWYIGSRRFPMVRAIRGYQQAMQSAGLPERVSECTSDDERESGYLAVKSILSGGERVSAIVTQNDSIAQGAYQALRAAGLRIPEDVSVVGVGDRPEAAALDPPLTTVWGFPDQVGRCLAELVLRRQECPELLPQQTIVPMQLIMRQSCARVNVTTAQVHVGQKQIFNATKMR
jgi:DNA-binding LacI/PurR family transcriptional regulator